MITSTSNPKIKQLVQLQKKKKVRDEKNVFLIEGIRMFEEIPREDILEIYCTESFYDKNPTALEVYKQTRIKIEILSDIVFQKVSETKTPQGILAVVKKRSYELEKILAHPNAHILVLDAVQDPGNVGTIIRTAEAAGVTGIILSCDTADIYQPKVIRSTMGAIFRVPCVYVENLENSIEIMKNLRIRIYAAHLKGKLCYNEVTYDKKIAFLIGNEGNGLSDEVANTADSWVKIPMEGQVESLNVATATTILVYEVYRQRRCER